MNKYIYALVESFYEQSPTEQMNKTLRDAKRAAKAYQEAQDARHQFIVNVLGKTMVKRFGDIETFAPIPVNALHIEKITREKIQYFSEIKDHLKPWLSYAQLVTAVSLLTNIETSCYFSL